MDSNKIIVITDVSFFTCGTVLNGFCLASYSIG